MDRYVWPVPMQHCETQAVLYCVSVHYTQDGPRESSGTVSYGLDSLLRYVLYLQQLRLAESHLLRAVLWFLALLPMIHSILVFLLPLRFLEPMNLTKSAWQWALAALNKAPCCVRNKITVSDMCSLS